MDPRNPFELLSFYSGHAQGAALETAWKGALVVTLAALLCAALRRVPAGVRSAVWSAALIGLLALPLLQGALPSWSIPLPQPETVAAPDAAVAVPAMGVAQPLSQASPAASAAAPIGFNFNLLWAWALGVFAIVARRFLGVFSVRLLARRAEPVNDPDWTSLLGTLRRQMRIVRPVTLLRLHSEITPLTWGIARPVILLPASADHWPVERRRVVLMHELAHIARHDLLTQSLAGLACALHWFNPLAWYAAHRQRLESERACDDRVLSAGTRASDYAGHLLAIAHGLSREVGSSPALAMARRSQIEDRMVAILSPGLGRRPSRLAVLAVVAGIGVSLVPLAAAQLSQSTSSTLPPPPDMPAAPRMPAPPTLPDKIMPAPGQGTPDDGFTFNWKDGTSQYMLTSRGDIQYLPDGTDVRQVGDGGRLLIEQRDGNTVRRLEVQQKATGIQRNWTVDGVSRPFDTEAGRWLAGALQSFHRLQGAQREQMREIVDREANQRRRLPGMGSGTGNPPVMSPPPAEDKNAPVLPPPTEFIMQQQELGAVLSDQSSRTLDAYLKQEKDFRERLLRATSDNSILREELRHAEGDKKADEEKPRQQV